MSVKSYTVSEICGYWGMTADKQRSICEEIGITRVKEGKRLVYNRNDFVRLMKHGGWDLINGKWAYKVQDDK